LNLNATNAPIGYHALYAKITGGGRTRYLYAPEIIHVLPAVIIISQPTNQTVWAGTNVTFSVSAVGVPTLKYQWKTNGINIALATNANYIISNVKAGSAANYSCLVSNSFGSATSSNALLTVLVPDTNKPTISITSPTSGQRWSNAVFNVAGIANDNVRVSNVWCQINGAGWNLASLNINLSNWLAQVALTPGTNTIAAYSVDTSGNTSAISSVSFQYVVTNQLQLFTTGLGTISPNYNNAWLEIGRNYSITSAPTAGFRFISWTGSLTTNTAALHFTMASNLAFTANFIDTNKPTLAITTPTSNQKMTNALANVIGTASDNWKVAGVWYRLNSNGWNLASTANNYTNWTTTLTLISGTNTIKAYALDLGGNYSLTNTLSIISSNTFTLQLNFTNMQPLKTNGLTFNLQLSKGLNGHIQVSTNLINWVTLTNFVGSNSSIMFRDPAAANSPRRFYRAVIP
jgi:hypothetical protein